MTTELNNPDLKFAKKQFNKDFSNVKDKACETCGALSDTTSHLRNNVQGLLQPSLDNLKEKQENIAVYIKEHPVKSFGLAMLAGLLITKIL